MEKQTELGLPDILEDGDLLLAIVRHSFRNEVPRPPVPDISDEEFERRLHGTKHLSPETIDKIIPYQSAEV